jgi:GntR family carbon starvation induced transcriptional regulator
LTPPGRNVLKEHIAIAQAVIERRTREAAQLLRHHIERTGRNVQIEPSAQA